MVGGEGLVYLQLAIRAEWGIGENCSLLLTLPLPASINLPNSYDVSPNSISFFNVVDVMFEIFQKIKFSDVRYP